MYAAKPNLPVLENRDGIQEVFEVFKVFAENPVRLGMQVAFGRVRRKTEPTGPGEPRRFFEWQLA